jgi:hypothetical protein
MHCTSPIQAFVALRPAATADGGCGGSQTLTAACALITVDKCSIAALHRVRWALLLH